VQLLRDQQVRLLGVPVHLPAVVRRRVEQLLAGRLRRQVPAARLRARHHHDARGARLQQRPQAGDQRDVTQVVGGHLPLEALRAEQTRAAHDAGVEDQGGEVVVAVEQGRGATPDLVEVGQIELDDARRAWPDEARCGPLARGRVAHGQHDVGAASDEAAGRLEADAAVGAGHDERAPGLVGQLPRMPGHAGSVRLAERPRNAP
jgi:hypothetical protein